MSVVSGRAPAPRVADASGSGDASRAPALELTGVSVRLGGRFAVRDADLRVARGDLVGLIGPNGAGKTTLLRTALGLVRPASGRVLVEGQAVRPGRVPIGYVPQRHEFAWEFPLSVEGVVMTGRTRRVGLVRRPGVEDWRAVDEALDRVRLSDLRDRPAGQLSGGQRQRVLVARALALRPSVLLLDEPFTGLDMPTQELLAALFASLAREGRAVLMTTHDLAAALHGCDRLVLLNGTVVATGTPRALADDVDAWTATFGVAADSPLLRILGAVA